MSSCFAFPASTLVLAACFGLTGAVFPGHFEVHGDLNSECQRSQPITSSDTTVNFHSDLYDWTVNPEFLSPLSSQSKQTVSEIEPANSPKTVHKCRFCLKAFKTIRGVLIHVGRIHKGETSPSHTEGSVDDEIVTTRTTTITTTTTTTSTTTNSTHDHLQHYEDHAPHGLVNIHCNNANSQTTGQATAHPTRQQPRRACTERINRAGQVSPVVGFSGERINLPTKSTQTT